MKYFIEEYVKECIWMMVDGRKKKNIGDGKIIRESGG